MDHLDEDIFSPIRFEAALDISVNSGGSIAHASNIECLFESPELKSDRQKNELMSNSISFDQNTKSKKLGLLNSPVSSDKSVDSNISRGSFTDLKENKAKNILIKENSRKTVAERNNRRESKQKETFVNSGQNEQKTKNIRPTTLLPSINKLAESNSLKDNKKEKVARKSTLSKNSSNNDSHKNTFVISSAKNCGMIKKSLAIDKNINLKKSTDTCEKEACTSYKTEKFNKSKPWTQHSDTSKPTSNPLFQSEYEVSVEKIAHDHISLECDKIRQNTYMQQLSFYKELNKIKDEMEHQHLTTTKRLVKVLEDHAKLHIFLKEKLRPT